MDNIWEYIRQKMGEQGYAKYTAEPIIVDQPVGPNYINANNEFYFLVAKTVHASTEILADNDTLQPSESANYGNYDYYKTKFFTGEILIGSTTTQKIEFIKVIPVTDRKESIEKYIDEQQEKIFQTDNNKRITHEI